MTKLTSKESNTENITKKKVIKESYAKTIPPKKKEKIVETEALLTSEEQWELSVKERVNEYLDNLLSVAKECNMGTRYFNPIKEVYESYTVYNEDLTNGAELRIVFTFADNLKLKEMKFT
jgi:hypothetical protein